MIDRPLVAAIALIVIGILAALLSVAFRFDVNEREICK